MDDLYTYRFRVDALEQTWRVWAELGDGLTDDQWSAATRCPGWDVAAVYAHHSAAPRDMSAPLPVSDAPGEPVTASEIIRQFNVPDGVAHTHAEAIADRVVSDATAHTARDLVDRFRVHGPRALEHLRQARATLIVPFPPSGEVLTVVEALRIVLLEATVHLLDVQRAVGHAPAVPASALTDTALPLAEVAPAVEFIEAATGRSAQSPLPVLR